MAIYDPDEHFSETPQLIKYPKQEFYPLGKTADSVRWNLAPGVKALIRVYTHVPDEDRGLSINKPPDWNKQGGAMTRRGVTDEFLDTYSRPRERYQDPEYDVFAMLVNPWRRAQLTTPVLVEVEPGSNDRINGDYDRSRLIEYGGTLYDQSINNSGDVTSEWWGMAEWNLLVMFHMLKELKLGPRAPMQKFWVSESEGSGVIYAEDGRSLAITLARVILQDPIPEGVHGNASASDSRPFWGELTFGHI